MIGGIGCDIVDITRFDGWSKLSRNRLRSLFSAQELIDCSDTHNELIAEKLAVRFAAKEAAYKALSQFVISLGFIQRTISFRTFCKFVTVEYTTWGVPQIIIDKATLEHMLAQTMPHFRTHLSISHAQTTAMAIVVVEAPG